MKGVQAVCAERRAVGVREAQEGSRVLPSSNWKNGTASECDRENRKEWVLGKRSGGPFWAREI